MAKNKSQDGKKVPLKKQIYQQITGQLSASLPGIKEMLGEKKFERRIRKAAKLLSQGIKEKAPKKIKAVKKIADSKKADTPEAVVEN